MKKDSYFNNNSILELLFDTVQKTKISDQSYKVIWLCLQEQILNNRFDLIYDYWSKAHQYLWLNIPKIFPEYDDFCSVLNKEEIENREKQRERFLEFHYALGGLLMFQANELKKKNDINYIEIYNLIHKLSKHTSSQPPQFYLIPDDINKLLNGYDSFDRNFTSDYIIQQRYPFPNLYHDIHHGGIICNWARKYFAYLFLNLYSIEEYFTYTKPFDLTPINDDDNKLYKINSQIHSFETLKKDVEELLLEKETLRELRLPINEEKGLKTNRKIDPLTCLDDYINTSKAIRKKLIEEQKVDKEKLNAFYSYTKELISNTIIKFSSLWKEQKNINKEEYYFNKSMLVDKMAFSNEQDIGYSNHDQILAQYIAQQYSYFCINIFRKLTTISYSLEKKDIKEGLDKLKIREDEHVIIYFGSNFESYELDNNNIKIINDFYGELSETFYILEEEDLPEVKSTEITDKENILIKDTEYIYADINDLHKEENKDLKDKLSKQYPDEDLDKKVQAYVLFKVSLKIKPNIKCVCIKCYQQYFEKGMPNKLEDVGPFN